VSARFIARPGLPGPFGALMDEYERAAEDFCRVVERFDAARFAAERPSSDPDCVSPRAIALHVVHAARNHANYIRKARGLPTELGPMDIARLASPSDVRPWLMQMIRFAEDSLEGAYDMPYEQNLALAFKVGWGPTYDPEMMLEHTIVHLLRHRRQLERW
jgi:hypothetical protein